MYSWLYQVWKRLVLVSCAWGAHGERETEVMSSVLIFVGEEKAGGIFDLMNGPERIQEQTFDH